MRALVFAVLIASCSPIATVDAGLPGDAGPDDAGTIDAGTIEDAGTI